MAKFVKKIKNGQIFFSMAKLSENVQINGQICENGHFFYGQPVWKMAKFSKFGHKMAKLATLADHIIRRLNFAAVISHIPYGRRS